MKVQLSIPGQPIAKARPRFARRGKFVTTYSPQNTEEGLWILTARQQMKEIGHPLSGAIAIKIIFYITRPKSHFGKKGLKTTAPIYPTGKPDVSNMLKFAEDCLNECFVWKDDSYLIDVVAKKRYIEAYPSTEIEISEVEDNQ